MDFTIKGSDCWESDAFQDKFIRDYFGASPDKQNNSRLEGKKSKNKRRRSKSVDKNDTVSETNVQEYPLTEMVTKKEKKNKTKKNKMATESNDIVEIDVHERSSSEMVAEPKKSKTKKNKLATESDDIVEVDVQKCPLTEIVAKPKKKKTKKNKMATESDDIGEIDVHERSSSEMVAKPKKSKTKKNNLATENDDIVEIDIQKCPLTEMVAKPKKNKTKKNKIATENDDIVEIDVHEHSSSEMVAKPKKMKKEKNKLATESGDIVKIEAQKYPFTEMFAKSKTKKNKLSTESNDIVVMDAKKCSLTEMITNPKKGKEKTNKVSIESDGIVEVDIQKHLLPEITPGSKKRKRTESMSKSDEIDAHGHSVTEKFDVPKKNKRKSSANDPVAEVDVQEHTITETVARQKRIKLTSNSNAITKTDDVQEHSSTKMFERLNKKLVSHTSGVQLINDSIKSECEKTANLGPTLSSTLERPKCQTTRKKKTRRGKRYSKSTTEANLQVSSSNHLLEQESAEDKYFRKTLEHFRNKFKFLKEKEEEESSTTKDFSLIKNQRKTQLSSSLPRAVELSNTKEKTAIQNNSSMTEDSPLLKKQKKAQLSLSLPRAVKEVAQNNSFLTEDFSLQIKQKKARLLTSLPRSFRSSALKEKAQKMLRAAKFRIVNEKLYCGSGKEAMNYFKMNKEAFNEYHEGYNLQVSKWPVNPVDLVIKNLQEIPNGHIIADLGCGNAKIATTFPQRTIYSYDLVPVNKHVIQCDISKVPLKNEAVDVAVFCLSLMGTNLNEYILEAHRILKTGGLLKIAEVESRINDLKEFIKSIEVYGFQLSKQDISHKMFVLLDFNKVKEKLKRNKLAPIVLSPCLYKKR